MNPASTVERAAGTVERRARVSVTLAFLLTGAGFGSWAARIPAVQRIAGLSEAELGLALFGIAIGSILSMPLAGALIGRHGSRPVVVTTAFGFSLALALPPVAAEGGLLPL